MTPISFKTAINYGLNATCFTDTILEKVDDYFFLGGRKAQVISGVKIGDSQGTQYVDHQSSLHATVLKIVSYCTLIIPAIVLVAKVILRSIYQFHLHPSKKEVIPPPNNHAPEGSPPGSPPPPDLDDKPPINPPNFPPRVIHSLDLDTETIPFDVPMQLSTEKVAKLYLKARIALAYISPGGDVLPVCNTSKSELPKYEDSFFYFEKIKGSDDYLIERKKDNGLSALNPFKLHHELKYNEVAIMSGEEFVKLGLDPLSFEYSEEDNCVSGRSNLPAYQHATFTWQEAVVNGQPVIKIQCRG